MLCDGKTFGIRCDTNAIQELMDSMNGSVTSITITKSLGFTLLEMLVVLVIVAILTTIAVPVYSTYVVHIHRLEAESTLRHIATSLEQYNTHYQSYEGVTLDRLGFSQTIANHQYRVSLNATETSFQISAIPIDEQAEKDTACGTLTLNDLGQVSSAGDIQACWS